VVGPRYIPGNLEHHSKPDDDMPSFFPETAAQRGADGEAPVIDSLVDPSTSIVPDADRITPPVAMQGFRAGHDLSMTVRIQSGLPILDLKCPLHEITVDHPADDATRAIVRLKEGVTLPDRDFVLSYRTADAEITDAVITHTDEREKFFTLLLQPPARVEPAQVVARELVFVLDTSGSMSGFPIETSKALMRRAIDELRPADRFNLITFAGNTAMLAPKPLDNTEANRHKALRFIDTLEGGGSTEMMKAIDAALGADVDSDKVRIVCFLTDGYVGNDMEIIAAVKRHAGTTRVFGFGIGESVNRSLLAHMSRAGRGDTEFVLQHSEADKAAAKFFDRIDAPVLTDIKVEFEGLDVEEVYPQRIEDLFASRPLVIRGRYTKAAQGVVRLTGRNAKGRWQRDLVVNLPEESPENSLLAPQWARAKVAHLMMLDLEGLESGAANPDVKREVIELGVRYELLTRYTSFVAVEERQANHGGELRTIHVPVEMPRGVSQAMTLGQWPSSPSSSMARVVGSNSVSPGAIPVPQMGTLSDDLEFGDDEGFGNGWGGNGGGGGFGQIPAMMMRRCSEEDRMACLSANGGTRESDDAVVKVLDWLMKQQGDDGGWCETHRRTATGFALLSYLGRCETALSERYGESVLRAIVFLIDSSSEDSGDLGEKPNDRWLRYERGIVIHALAEAHVFHKIMQIQLPGLEEAVRQGGQSLIDQALPSGGWAHGPGGEVDVILTSLHLQALHACKKTGMEFRQMIPCVKKALAAISKNQDQPGALALAYQMWDRGSDPVAARACETIARKPAFSWESTDADPLSLYLDSAAMFHAGGQPWKDFNALVLPATLEAQTADGSFPIIAGGLTASSEIPHAPRPGNAETECHLRTCLAALSLEVYYRNWLRSEARDR
jgi:hypothetical protein